MPPCYNFSQRRLLKKRLDTFIFNSVLIWVWFWVMEKLDPACNSATRFSKSPQLPSVGVISRQCVCPGPHVPSPRAVHEHPVVNKHQSKRSHQVQPLTELVLDEAMNLGFPLHPWNKILPLETWKRSSFAGRFPCWINEYRRERNVSTTADVGTGFVAQKEQWKF